MKLVLRFLKETRLFPLFMEYVRENQKNGGKFAKKHWSIAATPVSVLGQTLFTDFLNKRGISLPYGLSSYQLFAIWLKKINHPCYQLLMNNKVWEEVEFYCNETNIDEVFEVNVKKKKTTFKNVKLFVNKNK